MEQHDWLTSALAAFALRPMGDIREEVISEARRRIVDSLGVAIGAIDQPGPRAIRSYAARSGTNGDSVVWGSSQRSPLEAAVFANCAAVRYLDYNDAYFSEASGTHPSDIIPALIAVGEAYGASGRELLEAIVIGYEIAVSGADGIGARDFGWDHVNLTALGACTASGRLMGLSEEQLRNALGIAVVSHAAMGETREGHLSMWKGLAAGDAVRHAVYACRLAESGVVGPSQPFLGERGYLNLILKGSFADEGAFSNIKAMAPPERILDTHIKAWPIGVVSQSGVDAALQLSNEIDFDDIELVEVETFKAAIQRNGSPEKWRPMTRETADHSLPFGVATALRDGRVDSASFDEDKVRSPDMHSFLIDRVRLVEDPEMTAGYPEAFPTRVTVTTRSGGVHTAEVTYPRGHAKSPLTDDELAAKFRTLATPKLGTERQEALMAFVLDIDSASDIATIGELLRGEWG